MAGNSENGRPLHILTLTPFFPSQENEVRGCFIAEPLAELKQLGVDSSVIAVTPVYQPQYHASTVAPARWVRYPQIPGNFGLSSAGKFLYGSLSRHVQELHAIKPIDVIHAHAALPCGDAARRLSSLLNVRFVVTVHGLDVLHTSYQKGASSAWRRDAALKVYSQARTAICISGKVQEILKANAPAEGSSTVVYNGVDPALFFPNPDEVSPRGQEILIVGNLQRSKGHEVVLRALANLRSSCPYLRCRIIGEGPDRNSLAAMASDLGIGSQVQFVGRQTRLEVAEAMRRCTVFVLPSRNEGLGCVYLEAMSSGKPAIGCSGQGIDEVIEHGKNGWLVPADGLRELVQGLSTLLGSAELCSRLGHAARQTILETFTLSHQAKKLARIYRKALPNPLP